MFEVVKPGIKSFPIVNSQYPSSSRQQHSLVVNALRHTCFRWRSYSCICIIRSWARRWERCEISLYCSRNWSIISSFLFMLWLLQVLHVLSCNSQDHPNGIVPSPLLLIESVFQWIYNLIFCRLWYIASLSRLIWPGTQGYASSYIFLIFCAKN